MQLEASEQLPNHIRYTGQQYDDLTGQYYLRARYYNPELGRFMQEDVYQGDGLNLYAYCSNNPVVYYDPSGYKKGSNSGCPPASNNGGDGGAPEADGSGSDTSRGTALKNIKQDLGLNANESPVSQNMVILRDANGNPVVHGDKIIYSREMTYDVRNKNIKNERNEIIDFVVVQDHSYGHTYADGVGNQSSHFNVRPFTNTQNGKVSGMKGHYYFKPKYTWD